MCAVDREWQKDIGVPDGVVIEEIFCMGSNGIDSAPPLLERNRQTKLLLLIPFPVKRNKSQALVQYKSEE
jgi:hypothetical protein